ncbi:MFS transporter [Flexivirga sp. ID2601S]|uniref:MFS transporter n=1 Tax=Flexivirga aerilata TaxID=1656889 RepID=A0A849AFZ4_9MICO|nr:MFS transporter [Flexivirga aerilata]
MKHSFQNSVWRHRDVRIVVPARAVSFVGDGMLAVVLLLRLHDGGAGPWAVTGLLIATSLPLVVLIGPAGRAADRWDSRTVLAVALGAQALACLALVPTTSVAGTYALVAAVQTGQAFAGPTWSALVPRIVSAADDVGRMVALQQGLAQALLPVGAALGGVVYGLAGAQVAILVDAGTFGALLLGALAVRTRRGGRADSTLTGHPAIRRAGLVTLRADPVVWPLLLGSLFMVLLLAGVNVVEVFLVRDELGMSAAWYGVSELMVMVGALCGSVLAGRVDGDRARVSTTIGGFGAIALLVVVCGVTPWFPLLLVCSVGLGVASAAMSACFGALLVIRSPDAVRGRMSATVNGLMQLANVGSLLIFGALGTTLGVRHTFVAAAAVALLVALRLRAVAPQPELSGR